ncbi:MAG: hypothetical protein Kow00127_23300 [Bacteroidales bacterium]
MEVLKSNGERVPFDKQKFLSSLERAGATPETAEAILEKLAPVFRDGISTRKLYHKAYQLLHRSEGHAAARYRLKRALFDLGPSGYPFEKFLGELFRQQGFEVETGVILQGRCVTHEVDVVARKGEQLHLVECKFHSDAGRRSDVKVALYVHSRFNDIAEQMRKEGLSTKVLIAGWIATNTRFTEDAIQFAECAGMKVISWDYPSGSSLRDLVDKSGLHPVTVLKSLTKRQKEILLEKGLVLCRQLSPGIKTLLNLSERQTEKILEEASFVRHAI